MDENSSLAHLTVIAGRSCMYHELKKGPIVWRPVVEHVVMSPSRLER